MRARLKQWRRGRGTQHKCTKYFCLHNFSGFYFTLCILPHSHSLPLPLLISFLFLLSCRLHNSAAPIAETKMEPATKHSNTSRNWAKIETLQTLDANVNWFCDNVPLYKHKEPAELSCFLKGMQFIKFFQASDIKLNPLRRGSTILAQR